MSIAQTILEQLGGNRFVVMTGARELINMGNGLKMTIPRNMSKANRLEIVLGGDDLYTMNFYKHRNTRVDIKRGICEFERNDVIRKIEHVYFDQLEGLFTEVTGMYTRL